ncbi:MAG: demethoxyubiquinone hydroxylase family protein [Planctomycetaceae bacterium]|nr:demethoxyubiquinone hydroxylase family protein [Planctomycetaceae bacterium]
MEEQTNVTYDVSVIRPEVNEGQIGFRGQGFPPVRLAGIRKGLLTLHTLELMAATIYRFQIRAGQRDDLNLRLIGAMCNEMTHYQDFQVKLAEYGFKPNCLRWAFWLVGFALGFGSRLLGPRSILKTGVWVESKAVHHYAQLLASIEWDADTRRIIEKDQADEAAHIARWKQML